MLKLSSNQMNRIHIVTLQHTPTPRGMVLDTKEMRVRDGDLNKVLSSSTSVDWS